MADPGRRERNRGAQRRRRRRLQEDREADGAAACDLVDAAHDAGDGPLAERLIRWIGTLEVSEGPLAGSRFEVLPWEAEFLRGAFADGVFSASLTMGRGGGKTSLVAGLAAAGLAGPLARRRGEVVIAAASAAQAKIAYRHAREFLRPWMEAAPARWRVREAPHPEIRDVESGSRMVAISGNPRTAHGLAPSLVLLDEPAKHDPNKRDEMRAALATALGKQADARMIACGTRPSDPTHYFEAALARGSGPGRFVLAFAADGEADPLDPDVWLAANPSMTHFPTLARQIAAEADETRDDPEKLAVFRALRLNSGTAESGSSMLLSVAAWSRCEVQELPPAEGAMVLGLDMAGAAAMTGAAAYWPATGRLETLGAFPAIPDLRARGRKDGVGGEYARMANDGDLLQIGSRIVEAEDLLLAAVSRWGQPDVVVADRFRSAEVLDGLERAGVPVGVYVERGMGYRDGSQDLRGFRSACLRGLVSAQPSLLVRAALRECRTVTDVAGNAKIARSGEAGRRSRGRDDVAAAMVLAVAVGDRRERRLSAAAPGWQYKGVA